MRRFRNRRFRRNRRYKRKGSRESVIGSNRGATKHVNSKRRKFIRAHAAYKHQQEGSFVRTNQYQVTAATGLQTAYVVGTMLNKGDMADCISVFTGTLQPTGTPAGYNINKCLITYGMADFTFQNSSNCDLEMDFLVLKCSYDSTVSPITLWDNMASSAGNNTSWGGGSALTSTTWGNKYQMLYGLTAPYWKLKKSFTKVIKVGEAHKHQEIIKYHKFMYAQESTGEFTSANYMKRWTYVFLVLLRGPPGWTTGGSNLGTNAVGLAVACKQVIKGKYLSGNQVCALNVAGISANATSIFNMGSGATVTSGAL
nr:MAG: capsid protein [Cressdnaviricota sp.]